jgi:hypothetical protein
MNSSTVPAPEATGPELSEHGRNALENLLGIEQHDTGQSRHVADFLLAWWNAAECGGFDLTNLCVASRTIA